MEEQMIEERSKLQDYLQEITNDKAEIEVSHILLLEDSYYLLLEVSYYPFFLLFQ